MTQRTQEHATSKTTTEKAGTEGQAVGNQAALPGDHDAGSQNRKTALTSRQPGGSRTSQE